MTGTTEAGRYLSYSVSFSFVQQAVAQIPWGRNRFLTDRAKAPPEKED